MRVGVIGLRIREVARSYRRAVLAGSDPIGSDEHTRHIRELTLAEQRRVTREDGYWIAAADPFAAHYVR